MFIANIQDGEIMMKFRFSGKYGDWVENIQSTNDAKMRALSLNVAVVKIGDDAE